MNKMIERVAKAIGCIDADRCPFALSNVKEKREKRGTCLECLETAKDAIAAMREPTDEMIKANLCHSHDVEEAYESMIDAALK